MDITTDVLAAMRIIAEARELARTTRGSVRDLIDEVLAQGDVLAGSVGELTAALVRRFYPDGKPARAEDIAAFLRRYATEAREAGRLGGFLTDVPSPAAVLRAIDPKTFADVPDQFTRAPRGVFTGDARAAEAEQALDLSRSDPPAGAFDQGADGPAVIEADVAAAREMTEALADTTETDDFVPVRVDENAAAAEEAARAQLRSELGDLTIRLGDDTEWSARDILTDLEADDTLAATIDFCVTRPGGANG
jgi:hypothetical protein